MQRFFDLHQHFYVLHSPPHTPPPSLAHLQRKDWWARRNWGARWRCRHRGRGRCRLERGEDRPHGEQRPESRCMVKAEPIGPGGGLDVGTRRGKNQTHGSQVPSNGLATTEQEWRGNTRVWTNWCWNDVRHSRGDFKQIIWYLDQEFRRKSWAGDRHLGIICMNRWRVLKAMGVGKLYLGEREMRREAASFSTSNSGFLSLFLEEKLSASPGLPFRICVHPCSVNPDSWYFFL